MHRLGRTAVIATLLATTATAQDAMGPVSIVLSPEALKFSTQEPDEDYAERIYYQPRDQDGTVYYTPVWAPWNTFVAGGPIEGGDFYQMMSLVADPAYVQLFVVNESAELVSITSAELVVDDSRPDLQPIIAVNEIEPSPRIDVAELKNYGWGRVENAVARFDILPAGADPAYGEYRFEVAVGSFETDSQIDLKPAMQALGMDPAALLAAADGFERQYDPANIERALGALAPLAERDDEGIVTAKGRIAGELEFGWSDALGAPQRERLRFFFDHSFFERIQAEMGAAGAVSGRFDVELPVSGSDYVKRFPYKRSVEAGATDRIVVGIRSPRSSLHAFRLRLRLSDGRELLSPPCRLRFIVPRGLEAEQEYP